MGHSAVRSRKNKLYLHKCVRNAGTNIDHLFTFPVLSIAASGAKKPELFCSLTPELLNRTFKIADLSKDTFFCDKLWLHLSFCPLSLAVPNIDELRLLVLIEDIDANFHDFDPQYKTARPLFNTPIFAQ